MMQEASIQSKRHEVWSRLYELLDLNPGAVQPGGRGRVLMAIRPVVDVKALLASMDIQTSQASLIGAGTTYYTVPDQEEWMLYGYRAVLNAGDRDIAELNLLEPANTGGSSMPIDSFAAASSRDHMFSEPLLLRAGWVLRMFATGGTTDGNWTLNILTSISPSWLT